MGPDRWREIERLYHAALEKHAGERASFLDHACATDVDLRKEVESLLAFAQDADGSRTPLTPKKLGRYQILEQLGHGGMGIVFRAVDPTINRTVAIKTILAGQDGSGEESRELRDRLLRESQAGGRLSHPHIVAVYDVSEQDNTAYIVMEYVAGRTLARAMAEAPRRPAGEALRILGECASALDYAHSQGVVHRDVKPANILLQADGSVKITDFGIAKVAQLASLTQGAIAMGSPQYMAPEQWKGDPVTGQADQYALGAIAYEMLTGHRPFEGETMAALAAKTLYGDPPEVTAVNPALDPRVNSVFSKVLSKSAAARYESCTEFACALHAACEKKSHRKRAVPIFAAVLAILLIVGLGLGAWLYHRNNEARIEQMYWTSIKDSKSADPFLEYLKRYPQGRFAGFARLQVEALKKVPPLPNPVPVASKKPPVADPPEANRKSPQTTAPPPVKAVEEPPSRTDPYVVADALLRRGATAESLEYFSKAIAMRPEYRAYFGRASAYHRLERVKEAIEDYSQAILLKPTSAMAYHERAVCLARLEQNDRALSDYDKALELAPGYALSWNGRGAIFLHRKDYPRAINDFNEAIRLKPTLAQAFRNRAAARKATGDLLGAKADLNRAEELK